MRWGTRLRMYNRQQLRIEFASAMAIFLIASIFVSQPLHVAIYVGGPLLLILGTVILLCGLRLRRLLSRISEHMERKLFDHKDVVLNQQYEIDVIQKIIGSQWGLPSELVTQINLVKTLLLIAEFEISEALAEDDKLRIARLARTLEAPLLLKTRPAECLIFTSGHYTLDKLNVAQVLNYTGQVIAEIGRDLQRQTLISRTFRNAA